MRRATLSHSTTRTQVADDLVPQQPAGVLDGGDEELSTDKGINAPEDGNYESVKGNEISKGASCPSCSAPCSAPPTAS